MAAVQDEAQARGVVVNAPYDEAPSEQLCPGVPDVSDSGRLGRLDLLEPLPPPTFSNSRAPPPSRIGTTETTISSSSPAARYCCATDAPPPRDTSFSPAAARASSSADSVPSVTKWNVVPPCISSGSRGWLVRTKTGGGEGGSSPHQPFHDSSHGPGPPPNMFRPMMVAPAPPRMSSANGVLALTSPPSPPWLSRKALSGTSQSWSSSPPTPSGCSGDWSGPATKPSTDIVMFSFSLLIDPPSVDMLVGPPSEPEVIEQAKGRRSWGQPGQRNRQRRRAPERWNVQLHGGATLSCRLSPSLPASLRR